MRVVVDISATRRRSQTCLKSSLLSVRTRIRLPFPRPRSSLIRNKTNCLPHRTPSLHRSLSSSASVSILRRRRAMLNKSPSIPTTQYRLLLIETARRTILREVAVPVQTLVTPLTRTQRSSMTPGIQSSSTWVRLRLRRSSISHTQSRHLT
jgi:hypothetical protein